MSNWFPKIYDRFMTPLEKRPSFLHMRKRLVEQASGRVLEIGAGTGVNLPLYGSNVEELWVTDPSPEMIQIAREKHTTFTMLPFHFQQADAEHLPFASSSFNTVIGTLVFCSIPNPDIALQEIERVLKPGGKLLLFEHVQMPQPLLKSAQDLLTPIWKHLCDGCHLNRDTLNLLQNSPFEIEAVSSIYKKLFISIVARKSFSPTE